MPSSSVPRARKAAAITKQFAILKFSYVGCKVTIPVSLGRWEQARRGNQRIRDSVLDQVAHAVSEQHSEISLGPLSWTEPVWLNTVTQRSKKVRGQIPAFDLPTMVELVNSGGPYAETELTPDGVELYHQFYPEDRDPCGCTGGLRPAAQANAV